jgi:hypothetical protein
MQILENLRKILADEYGITTEKELDRAIAGMRKPNIGLFAGETGKCLHPDSCIRTACMRGGANCQYRLTEADTKLARQREHSKCIAPQFKL